MHSNHSGLRLLTAAVLAIAALMSLSCASAKPGSRREPGVIAIRNLSGADIASASLRKAGAPSHASPYGSVSPVPNGLTQEVGRPTDPPPPLPNTVAIEWVDEAGRSHLRELSLAAALKGAAGGRGEALVFEIGRSGGVRVFVEPRPIEPVRN